MSRLGAEIDVRVNAFPQRPLDGVWPCLCLDATHIKMRDRGGIVSRVVMVAGGLDEEGNH